MTEIMNLREKRVQTWNAAKAFLESHRGNDGMLSAEDDAIYNKMVDDMDRMGKEIARLEKLEALDVEMSRATSKPLTSAPVAAPDDEAPVSKTGRAARDYTKNFWRVMRSKSVPHEVMNALQVGTETEGGYLVPDEYEHTLVQALEEQNIFRQLAHVIHTSSGDRKIPVVASKGTAQWIDEEAQYPESDDSLTRGPRKPSTKSNASFGTNSKTDELEVMNYGYSCRFSHRILYGRAQKHGDRAPQD